MADQCPNKSDIQAIFKRLRNLPANKVCFDCNSKNPTWATVTYGVFICIDCSAVHRGLGVHLTFVRSTQLDTNWTWIQLRQMQLGGNANANAFFRQHNCTTTDAQQKYNSRAAQLYREKLHQMSIQAMRVHGNKVHLDSTHEHSATEEKKEVDFFDVLTSSEASFGFDEPQLQVPQVPKLIMNNQLTNKQKLDVDDMGEPNVDLALNSDNPSSGAARKPTIGSRKPAPKKGLGAKKGGLGAQRVKANFEDLEREAQIADEQKVRAEEDSKKVVEVKAEEQENQLASMRLAYQDLGIKQKKEEERMKQSDPKKALQMERLGMGFASRTGVSHSALSDMKTIEQEGVMDGNSRPTVANTNRSAYESDFFDDFYSGGGYSMYKGSQNESKSMEWVLLESGKERGGSNGGNGGGSKGWTDQEPRRSSASLAASNSSSSSSDSRHREAPPAADGTEAQKKFGSAKAISSDQFFNDSKDNDWERKSNLSRFEGSSSISSSDYFNDGRGGGGGSVGSRGSSQPSMQGPDLEDVKESVRQGVTKVAGRLSNLANGVMSSIQERYGY